MAQDAYRRREKLALATSRLTLAFARGMEVRRQEVLGASRMLEGLSHKSILARGFAMVHREDGALVRAAKDLAPGDEVQLTFSDGDQKAVIAPPSAAPEAPKRAKAKPGGDQGSLF